LKLTYISFQPGFLFKIKQKLKDIEYIYKNPAIVKKLK
jgi:hypothetical protein